LSIIVVRRASRVLELSSRCHHNAVYTQAS
jgi:hypothetical protein